jgi:geranylgeranyl diphosphate synthase type II
MRDQVGGTDHTGQRRYVRAGERCPQHVNNARMPAEWFFEYMAECRGVVLAEFEELVRRRRGKQRRALYELVLDYPMRSAKALRPSLCIATCRALGGSLAAVAGSAMTLELYHNAFLIHDDVEDGSDKRRDELTLHRAQGLSIAVNVGDAMLALALEPLLDNMRLIGVGKALLILQLIAQMARESAEGQATELEWCRKGDFRATDADYLRMVHQKTTYYSFIAPVAIGALVAGAPSVKIHALRLFATALGTAFQIRDDILNLAADRANYGKDLGGDLWEGKHTLILLHALRSCSEVERAEALRVLRKPRARAGAEPLDCAALFGQLESEGVITASARARLEAGMSAGLASQVKSHSDVQFLRSLIDRYRSLDYAYGRADMRAARAQRTLQRMDGWLSPGIHRDFLHELTRFVVERDH